MNKKNKMAHWHLDDIPWDQLDRSKIQPEFVALAKAASMVEQNSADYARYLCEVFADDEEMKRDALQWAREEVQHGMALRKWAELADPDFNFDESFKTFTEGYKLPQNVKESVRGSGAGELVARCIVEIGTSSYYSAIKDATDEPVLKAVCAKIAADEYRHYKLFYDHLQRYLKKDNIGGLERLKVALGRIVESEDDELAYAYYAANRGFIPGDYDRKRYSNHYFTFAFSVYRRSHVDKMVAMIFKAVGLKTNGWLNRAMNWLAWHAIQLRLLMAQRAVA